MFWNIRTFHVSCETNFPQGGPPTSGITPTKWPYKMGLPGNISPEVESFHPLLIAWSSILPACHQEWKRYLKWRDSWTLWVAIFGMGFPLHKPYPYSLDRWGFLHLRYLKCLVSLVFFTHVFSRSIESNSIEMWRICWETRGGWGIRTCEAWWWAYLRMSCDGS